MVKHGSLIVVAFWLFAGALVNAQDKSTSSRQTRALPAQIKQLALRDASDGAKQGAVNHLGWSVSLFENRAHIGAFEDAGGGEQWGVSFVLDYDGINWTRGEALSEAEELLRVGHGCSFDTANVQVRGFPFDLFGQGGQANVRGDVTQELHAGVGIAGDKFGWSVAHSGDLVLIGAPGVDDEKGSAFVFAYDGTSWIEVQELNPSNGKTGDQFGFGVSLFGDRALVGAPGDNENSGAVYVFEYDGTSWVQVLKLTGSDSPLPVELTTFRAVTSGSNISVSWATASEFNNAGFAVELSPSDRAFERVGFITGHGTTNIPRQYELSLSDITPGPYFLRLKQIDFDGTFFYSETVNVVVGATAYTLTQNYPNPFNPQTHIHYTLPVSNHVRLEVFNLLGQPVQLLVNEAQAAGSYAVRFDAHDLPNGTYSYRLTSGSFTETKTMVLLK
ncbi:MAG: T9SS type A sorting domain-containing protein [Bacteroidota bacterium]